MAFLHTTAQEVTAALLHCSPAQSRRAKQTEPRNRYGSMSFIPLDDANRIIQNSHHKCMPEDMRQ